jgi:hypothetical protein
MKAEIMRQVNTIRTITTLASDKLKAFLLSNSENSDVCTLINSNIKSYKTINTLLDVIVDILKESNNETSVDNNIKFHDLSKLDSQTMDILESNVKLVYEAYQDVEKFSEYNAVYAKTFILAYGLDKLPDLINISSGVDSNLVCLYFISTVLNPIINHGYSIKPAGKIVSNVTFNNLAKPIDIVKFSSQHLLNLYFQCFKDQFSYRTDSSGSKFYFSMAGSNELTLDTSLFYTHVFVPYFGDIPYDIAVRIPNIQLFSNANDVENYVNKLCSRIKIIKELNA